MWNKQTTNMSHYIERIRVWTYYNTYARVSFFTHTAHAFGMISFEDWVLEPWFSNHKVKLAKHKVMVSIIFIISLIMDSSSCPLGCLGMRWNVKRQFSAKQSALVSHFATGMSREFLSLVNKKVRLYFLSCSDPHVC